MSSTGDDPAPTIDSPEEFGRVLRLGLGRAVLFLLDRDPAPYRDIVRDACTRWTGDDQQVEGTRTNYLLDVLHATGEPERYRDPILAALQVTSDSHDLNQLLGLVLALARAGDDAARTSLYRRFEYDSEGS